MTRFRIEYTVPGTEDRAVVEQDFEDTPPSGVIPGFNDIAHNGISARQWAEDYAYTLADKRMDYKITEIQQCKVGG